MDIKTPTRLCAIHRASLVAQMVKKKKKKNLPAMQETQVRFLGCEVLLEKEIATHSSILAWRILWIEEPGQLLSMGSQRVRSDWAANIMHYAIHSPLDHWNQKIDDVNSHLPHHQWMRRISTNWSLSLWAIIIKLLISPSRLGHTVLRVFIYCGKFFKRWEYQTTLSSSWETCMQVEK